MSKYFESFNKRLDTYEDETGSFLDKNKLKIGEYVALIGGVILLGLGYYHYKKKKDGDEEQEQEK